MSMATGDRFTVYACPRCGWASLRPFTVGQCVRCLSAVTAREIEVGLADDNRAVGALTTALHQAQLDRDRYRDVLDEVAGAGVTFDDLRVGYVEVQINRVTWDELQKLTPAVEGES